MRRPIQCMAGIYLRALLKLGFGHKGVVGRWVPGKPDRGRGNHNSSSRLEAQDGEIARMLEFEGRRFAGGQENRTRSSEVIAIVLTTGHRRTWYKMIFMRGSPHGKRRARSEDLL